MLFALVDILIVNETEFASETGAGRADIARIVKLMCAQNDLAIIITLGAQSDIIVSVEDARFVPAAMLKSWTPLARVIVFAL